jgi:hypothetical protein
MSSVRTTCVVEQTLHWEQIILDSTLKQEVDIRMTQTNEA